MKQPHRDNTITHDDLRRLPTPPRKIPWVMGWYLFFRNRGLHLLWAWAVVWLMLGIPVFPKAVKLLVPWSALHYTTSARIVKIDYTALLGSDDPHNTADDWTPTGHICTYHYVFRDAQGHPHRGWIDEVNGEYTVGQRITVRYLPQFPALSRMEGIGRSWNGHEFLIGLAMPLLSVVIFIVACIVHIGTLRFLRYGIVTSATYLETVPIPRKEREPGECRSLLRYRFVTEDGREWVAETAGRTTKQYGDSSLVIYLPSRPSNNLLLPKRREKMPFIIDQQGQVKIIPGNNLFIVLLPALYLGGLLLVTVGALWAMGVCVLVALLLWHGISGSAYQRRVR